MNKLLEQYFKETDADKAGALGFQIMEAMKQDPETWKPEIAQAIERAKREYEQPQPVERAAIRYGELIVIESALNGGK